jgi:hypothetical protein
MTKIEAQLGETGGTWQRWTIDELYESKARLLVSEPRDPREAAAVTDAVGSILTDDGRGRAAALRQTAMDVELAADRWGDERTHVVDRLGLEALLKARAGKPGLPGPRPLREGDVFWVFAVGGDQVDPGALVRDRVVVLDVTAAARQVAKRTYAEAVARQFDLSASEPSEPGG